MAPRPNDAPPRAVSPTLEAARPVSPIAMSPAQTPAAVNVVDAPPPAVDAMLPTFGATDVGSTQPTRAASTKVATPQGHRVVTMSSGSNSVAQPPTEPEPAPPPPAVEPYRPKSTGAAMLDAIEADILNLETTLETAPVDDGFAAFETAAPVDNDEGLVSFDATPAADDGDFAAGADAPDFTATTPSAPRGTVQQTSPFEAAIAARRARSEAQTDADQRPDPLARARATTVI